ncbi:MAG: hypothetical protein SFU57_01405 [Gemmatimonadales bacterium]|nr:hypothetical protein [Gemmatimonadales bacterium]
MRIPAALSVAILVVGCAGRLPGPTIPDGHLPMTAGEVAPWIAATERDATTQTRFSWRFLDEKGTASGRGAAQIAPPDSLRFDFRGPLGSGSGAAAVIGDTAIWAEPEDQVERLVPNYPLLWAILGQARYPHQGDLVSGMSNERLQAWRYVNGIDTVDYVLTRIGTRQLVADVRQGRNRIGRVFTTFDAAGRLIKSRLDIPGSRARLDITFDEPTLLDSIPRERWVAPDDAQ